MDVFGLIGKELQHSFSAQYFTERFKKTGFRGCYNLYEIEEEHYLPHFLQFACRYLSGCNVTIPYKEAVIPYLQSLCPKASSIGAVNCIKVKDGNLIGYNTDYIGFLKGLKTLDISHIVNKKALILGTGGASKAVVFALNSENWRTQLVSRKKTINTWDYQQLLQEDISKFDLIVNTTPLGMNEWRDQAPQLNWEQVNSKHICYDLIYNPEKTVFLQMGEQRGAQIINGHKMLIEQAEASWEIWKE